MLSLNVFSDCFAVGTGARGWGVWPLGGVASPLSGVSGTQQLTSVLGELTPGFVKTPILGLEPNTLLGVRNVGMQGGYSSSAIASISEAMQTHNSVKGHQDLWMDWRDLRLEREV